MRGAFLTTVVTTAATALMTFTALAGPTATEVAPTTTPEGLSSFRFCITTFDQATLISSPDQITIITFVPPNPDIAVTLLDDGCAFLDNVSPGPLTIKIETARGFSTENTVDVQPGEHGGQINFGILPPIVDGGMGAPNLPINGSGPANEATPLAAVLAVGLISGAAIACGEALRRRAS